MPRTIRLFSQIRCLPPKNDVGSLGDPCPCIVLSRREKDVGSHRAAALFQALFHQGNFYFSHILLAESYDVFMYGFLIPHFVKGVKNVVFYQLPSDPKFYSDVSFSFNLEDNNEL